MRVFIFHSLCKQVIEKVAVSDEFLIKINLVVLNKDVSKINN